MTTPPDWVTRIPSADIHTLPTSPLSGPQTPSTDFVRGRLKELLPTLFRYIFGQVGMSFGGADTPDWEPLAWLADWAKGTANTLGMPASSTLAEPLDLAAIWKNLMENIVPDTAIFAGKSAQGNTLIDFISQAFSGIEELSDIALDEAKAFMRHLYDQVLQTVRQIQELQTEQIANRYAGNTWSVDFEDYPDGPLPALFSVSYFGAGTSTVVVHKGRATWDLVNDANRGANILYNEPTGTDFQTVRATMGAPPSGSTITGGTPRIWAILRADSLTNPQNFVWARAYDSGNYIYKGDIGCTVGGIEKVWQSGINLTWSMDMTVIAGIGESDRVFQVFSGNKLVISHEDVDADSMMGPGFRHWGSRAEMVKGLLGANGSGSVKSTSVTDATPPDVLAPIAHMYRASTANVNFPANWTPLPASFWQVVLRDSAWITANTTTGRMTVHRADAYIIVVSLRVGTNIGATTKIGLRVNGSLTQVQPQNDVSSGQAMTATFIEYLLDGDEVDIATNRGGVPGDNLQAEATGTETFFAITGTKGD